MILVIMTSLSTVSETSKLSVGFRSVMALFSNWRRHWISVGPDSRELFLGFLLEERSIGMGQLLSGLLIFW